MNLKTIIYAMLGIMISTSVSADLNCVSQPSCQSLGYSKTETCSNGTFIYCPFDTSYKKCISKGINCEELGFTTDDKSTWCGNIIKCPNNEQLTTCSAEIKTLCSIGDVFYSDGTCSSVEKYDNTKTVVGVVYALSAEKGGMPYTTAEAEADGFSAEHGKVINLKDLTYSSTYSFAPTNPYGNSTSSLFFGLYQTDVENINTYNNAELLSAFQSNDFQLYNGKENTANFAIATPEYSKCTDGSYTSGSQNHKKYCAPTIPNIARAFYPVGTNKDSSITGAGQWYLPAVGELLLLCGFDTNKMTSLFSSEHIGTTYAKVNATLSALENKGVSAKTFTNNDYWSSTEYTSGRSVVITLNGNYVGYISNYNRDISNFLRVSLDF